MKKLMVWLLACVMLTGCSLAQDGEPEQGMMPADQLVGMLITVDYFLEYAPRDMPKVYKPMAKTGYLLVEAHHEKGITRTVCDRNDETARIQSFYPSDYGILIQGWTSIDWEGSK